MKTRAKVLLITLTVGVPAFFLGSALFPSPVGARASSAAQLMVLFLGTAEALALGLGVAFALFGWARILNNAGPPGPPRMWAMAVCLSVTWLLVSPWLYENLHRHVGGSAPGLLYLEYGFHITLMACGAVLACSLLRHDPLIREARRMTRIV